MCSVIVADYQMGCCFVLWVSWANIYSGRKGFIRTYKKQMFRFSSCFIHRLMISFIMLIKCKIFVLRLDARGQQNDREGILWLESTCSKSVWYGSEHSCFWGVFEWDSSSKAAAQPDLWPLHWGKHVTKGAIQCLNQEKKTLPLPSLPLFSFSSLRNIS